MPEFSIPVETCPECGRETALTIIEEDGSPIFICDNLNCNSMWDPRNLNFITDEQLDLICPK